MRTAGYITSDRAFAAARFKTCADAKAAGYTCTEAKEAGFSPQECCAAGFSLEEGKAAGYKHADKDSRGAYSGYRQSAWHHGAFMGETNEAYTRW